MNIIFWLFLFLPFFLMAQQQFQPKNLVYNPSFEYYKIPDPNQQVADGHLSFSEQLAAWKAANKNTPDLKVCDQKAYQNCRQRSPYCVQARTGKNVVGLMFYMSNYRTDTYREYITVPLKEYLRPGVKTHIEAWICKGNKATLVCNNLGFYFSRGAVRRETDTYLPFKPQFNHPAVMNQDTQRWEKITGSFIPQQPYKQVTIGNFYDNKGTTTATSIHHSTPAGVPASYAHAYYLIEDVRIWQEDDSVEVVPPYSTQKNTPVPLENIVFETNSTLLLSSSIQELKLLTQFLKGRPDLRVAIHGHTDNVGSAADNLSLSQSRAQVVVNFLVKEGIDKGRLEAKGFGAQQPLADNKTPPGRAKNRRVEFIIL